MGYKVAVVGATGNVGREMLDILAERRADPAFTRAFTRALLGAIEQAAEEREQRKAHGPPKPKKGIARVLW